MNIQWSVEMAWPEYEYTSDDHRLSAWVKHQDDGDKWEWVANIYREALPEELSWLSVNNVRLIKKTGSRGVTDTPEQAQADAAAWLEKTLDDCAACVRHSSNI